jgi:hypothetical protein
MIGAGASIGGMSGFAGGATGGGGGGGGGGFGMPQMMMIQMAMQEKNREAADRWRLAQGLSAAMNDSQWLMEHFPNFWGTSYVNPNAGAVDASLGQQNAIVQSAIQPMAEQKAKLEQIKTSQDSPEGAFYKYLLERQRKLDNPSTGEGDFISQFRARVPQEDWDKWEFNDETNNIRYIGR